MGRVQIDAIVAPIAAAGKLGDGHQLDSRNPQFFQGTNSGGDAFERSVGSKRSSVEFVEDIFAKRETLPVLVGPDKGIWIDNLRRAVNASRLRARDWVGPARFYHAGPGYTDRLGGRRELSLRNLRRLASLETRKIFGPSSQRARRDGAPRRETERLPGRGAWLRSHFVFSANNSATGQCAKTLRRERAASPSRSSAVNVCTGENILKGRRLDPLRKQDGGIVPNVSNWSGVGIANPEKESTYQRDRSSGRSTGRAKATT